jgi:hypothetical protein
MYHAEKTQSGLSSRLVISARMCATESLKSLQTHQAKMDGRPAQMGGERNALRCP